MEFVETAVFTRQIAQLGLESVLQGLQVVLIAAPERAPLVPGTGGLRKIRIGHPARGKGTRSGARVHYLFLPHRHRTYLVFVYAKGEQEDLTAEQKRILRVVVEGIKRS